MGIDAGDDWRLKLRLHGVVLVWNITLRPCLRDIATQFLYFLFHLGMLTALADTLEVGFDLAVEFQTDASGAAREGVLDNIASQLLPRNIKAVGQQFVVYYATFGRLWLGLTSGALLMRRRAAEGLGIVVID